VPPLRFKEFEGEWEKCRLGKIATIVGGGTPDTSVTAYWNGDIQWFTPSEIGKLTIMSNAEVAHIARQIMSIRSKNKASQIYVYQYLIRTINIIRERSTGIIPGIDRKSILSLPITIPSVNEQQKIASFLSLIDERIATQSKVIEKLESLIRGIVDKIFCTPEMDMPLKRLGEFRGKWVLRRLGDVCSRIIRKNKNRSSTLVLTIAAQSGLISQDIFFNKSVASANLDNYYLLEKGDFAYNKSYSNDYPWGAVKRLDKYESGVLSTLYICFCPNKEEIDSDFLMHYFESTKWYKGITDIAGEGARNHGLLNISIEDYFNTVHRFPCVDEQRTIAGFLNILYEKKDDAEVLLYNLNKQKRYFLQQMFI
jgi:type I restriction enzyme S subunit